MNTTDKAGDLNLKAAIGYYNAMLSTKYDEMGSYLDDNVHFIGPLAEMHGKDAVVSAARNLSQLLGDITIRSQFAHENQVMLAYDFTFPQPIGKLRAAVLMDFADGLIARIELFYDGRPFEAKKNEIFTQK